MQLSFPSQNRKLLNVIAADLTYVYAKRRPQNSFVQNGIGPTYPVPAMRHLSAPFR